MVCTFFGHKNTSEAIKNELKSSIEYLINKGVKNFYVGNNGNFDLLVQNTLLTLQKVYADIDYKIVISYINEKAISGAQSLTIFPEGLEIIHPKFAISKRNEWLIDRADYVISYCTNSFTNCHKWIEKATKKGLTIINLHHTV